MTTGRIQLKNNFLQFVSVTTAVFLFLYPSALLAQVEGVRSASFEEMAFTYTVNQNSTIDVEESELYNYVGTFHSNSRWIPIGAFRFIDRVVVVDGVTGLPLV